MDREQAHKLLGLYIGASPEHVEAKYKALVTELKQQLEHEPSNHTRGELQAQLENLVLARNVALGLAPDASAPQLSAVTPAPHLPVWRRGPVVLLMLALALVICVAGFYVAARWLDNKQSARETGDKRDLALAAQQAWEGYRAKAGLAQTTDAQRAVATLQDAQDLEAAGDHARAGEGYAAALDLFNAAFESENARLAALWQNEVVEPWNQQLKGRFPFSETGEEEADPELVARLFNPVSGTVWSKQREFDALRSTELDGRVMGTVPEGYTEALAQAGRIRTALFGADSERIHVVFSIRLVEETKTMAELVLETGGAKISHRAQQFVTATWTPDTAGARLLLKKLGDRTPTSTPIDYGESGWGMLQLLNYCSFTGEQDGEYVWEVEFDGLADRRGKTRSMTGSIRIKLDRAENPFDFATYAGFNPG
ncbi:MAG: hypothetical protein H6841_07030 [Planctomycetes bacterium]|nr:hypothetical protein [Planctomycetota bacterium]MCB9935274.1 hypothetical protein [Planctomycetota bacterium]